MENINEVFKTHYNMQESSGDQVAQGKKFMSKLGEVLTKYHKAFKIGEIGYHQKSVVMMAYFPTDGDLFKTGPTPATSKFTGKRAIRVSAQRAEKILGYTLKSMGYVLEITPADRGGVTLSLHKK